MITVPEVIEELVKDSPFLEEGLSLGIVNYSALARELQPRIRTKLLKDIQEGAIVMALKRLSTKLKASVKSSARLTAPTDLTVRSNLTEFTFANSPALAAKQSQLIREIDQEKNIFFTFTRGVFETTLIISSSLEKEVEKVFAGEKLNEKFSDLSAITLILPRDNIYQPGTYYAILKKLAWEKINIMEVISSVTELTIVLDNSQVDRAFSILKNLTPKPL